MSPFTDGQDLFACTVDESAGMADECSCYEAGRDPMSAIEGRDWFREHMKVCERR